jgi:transcriptional regulator with XRE-family HTH domain
MKVSERASLRKRAGLTQFRLAKSAGIPTPRVSLWESGEVELPPDQVLRIAKVLYRNLSNSPAFNNVTELVRALAPPASAVDPEAR